MKRGIVILVLACLSSLAPAVLAQDRPAAADADSLNSIGIIRAVREDKWGPVPRRQPANTARLQRAPKPGWEKAVDVPYFIVGIPFRILDYGVHQGISAADNLGLFDMPPGDHRGLRLPGDFYLLPDFGISGLEGTTYGLNATRYDFFGPGNRLYLTGSISTRQAEKLAIGALLHLNSRIDLQLGGGVSQLPQTKYYGLGPLSERENLSYYNRISDWLGLELDHDLGRKLDLEFRAFYSEVEARASRYEVDRALGDVHAGNLPPGYPGRSCGYTWRLGMVRNNAAQTGRPETGGLQKASIGWFNDSNDDGVEFFTYTLDLQHFFSLWHTKRTLGIRGFFNRIDNRGETDVPLTRLVSFHRPDELRGFSSLRYYGLNSLGVSVEYRWPVWVAKGREGPGLDAYLFSDTGQVYMESREISVHNLEFTGGFGFRFIGGSRDFVGRFELGFSGEETVVTLRFSQNFQYDTKTFVSGQDPTRRR